MAFASAEFALCVRQEDGATLRDHLLTAYSATGVMPPQIQEAPELPASAAHIWEWFCELDASRKDGSAIGYGDIKDWAELTRTRIRPWEVKALRMLDKLYFREVKRD